MFNEEGILNKLVTAAVIGLLSWNVMTTKNLSVEVAVLNEKVDNRLSDAYSRTEAVGKAREVELMIRTLEARVKALENALE